MGREEVTREEIYRACRFLYAGICIKEHASSKRVLLFFFEDCFLTDRANELTRGILKKGCKARVLLFLVNLGYPIVWGYNSRENKSRNPFPSVVQLLTSPDCLVIDLDSTTNNYVFSYERLFSLSCRVGIPSTHTLLLQLPTKINMPLNKDTKLNNDDDNEIL